MSQPVRSIPYHPLSPNSNVFWRTLRSPSMVARYAEKWPKQNYLEIAKIEPSWNLLVQVFNMLAPVSKSPSDTMECCTLCLVHVHYHLPHQLYISYIHE